MPHAFSHTSPLACSPCPRQLPLGVYLESGPPWEQRTLVQLEGYETFLRFICASSCCVRVGHSLLASPPSPAESRAAHSKLAA